MKYLIDTHILLWWLFDYEKIPGKIFRIMMDGENEVFVSVLSLWEIALKYSIGKLNMGAFEPGVLPERIKKSGFAVTDLRPEVVANSYKLKRLEHGDPFDRLIVWEAINCDYILLSNDAELKQYESSGLRLFVS